MAASIPVLRTLFHEHLRTRSRRYYSSHVIDDSGSSSRHAQNGNVDTLVTMPVGEVPKLRPVYHQTPSYFSEGGTSGTPKSVRFLVRETDTVYGGNYFPSEREK